MTEWEVVSSAEEFAKLVTCGDPGANRKAKMARAADSVWMEVIVTQPVNIREMVFGNRWLPEAILEKLASDQSVWVRRRVSDRASLSEALCRKLHEDEDAWVRRSVAMCRNIPTELLEKLASDPDENVRAAAADHLGYR